MLISSGHPQHQARAPKGQIREDIDIGFDSSPTDHNQVILNPAPAVPLPEDIYQHIDCLITNESEADILRGSETPLQVEDCPTVCEQFLRRGVRDISIITLGGQVSCCASFLAGHCV
jgi:sugar/nucleoside kinase (ribokinase family)